jgi:hypothetical protein
MIASLSKQSKLAIALWIVLKGLGNWIRVVVRELFMHRYILGDRKHMQKPGRRAWLMMLTVYPIVERLSVFIFFTCATYAMLWKSFQGHKSITYVVAPKAFHEEPAKPGMKKSA